MLMERTCAIVVVVMMICVVPSVYFEAWLIEGPTSMWERGWCGSAMPAINGISTQFRRADEACKGLCTMRRDIGC